jgi:hypothetical protein
MRPDFSSLVSAQATVSDNIRALARAGYSRAEIAGLLGKRYQHVRNVLVDDERKASSKPDPDTATRPQGMAEGRHIYQPPPARTGEILVWVDVAPNGSLQLPEPACAALEIAQSGRVLVQVSGDGSVALLSARTAMLQAQAIMRSFVPAGVSVVDELLAERKAEAARENEDD